MADAVAVAIGKLDGRNADSRRTEPWLLNTLYKRTDKALGPKSTPIRKNGGSTSDTPGEPWNTPSALDKLTVLAEVLTQVYVTPDGRELTAFDMLIELHQAVEKL